MPVRLMPLCAASCLLACLLLAGCSGEAEAPETPPVTPPPAAPAQEPAKPDAAEPNDKPAGEVSEDQQSDQQESAVAEYQSPYPDRENLFLAPKRSASNTKSPGNEQSVELLGFANVQGQRVILSINGNVVPIAEGGTEAGIEVISIQPPAVVLQRDRERWQATLDN